MAKINAPILADYRRRFHAALLARVLTTNSAGIPSNADGNNAASVSIAVEICKELGSKTITARLAGQTSGGAFEDICANFLSDTFARLAHLRPGKWDIKATRSRNRLTIAKYQQYIHVVALFEAAKKDKRLAAALGSDYTITPDIVIAREPEDDAAINAPQSIVDNTVATHADLRRSNHPEPLLHASISCKWTIRSDRSQNSRSEALNLIRNRKGRLPHIVVVTGEPLPSRIASIALGTGDIDCVYHFALPELVRALHATRHAIGIDLLETMIEGKRLKDISDLPLDLAV
jgi:hypothetical protein